MLSKPISDELPNGPLIEGFRGIIALAYGRACGFKLKEH